MNEELKKCIKENICKNFSDPEKDTDCEGRKIEDCLNCAKNFITGWNCAKIETKQTSQ